MMMNVEQSVELELAGETKYSENTFPQCHFVHHKSQEHAWEKWEHLEDNIEIYITKKF
jgi:uncharacterized protein (DUF1919 family)